MDLVCSYASKPCDQPRAVRANGQLHSFCEEHRRKANDAQKRWYDRRREAPAAAGTPIKLRRAKSDPVQRRRTSTKAASKKYGCMTFRTSTLAPSLTLAPRPLVDAVAPSLNALDCSLQSLLAFEWDPSAVSDVVDLYEPQHIDTLVFQV